MTEWNLKLITHVQSAVEDSPFWGGYLEKALTENSVSLHLGIFIEPYLRFILEGKKTVESRFSTRFCPPYKNVNKGDVIILKKSGGPVLGLCRVSQVWFYELDPKSWKDVKRFSKAICANNTSFWEERKNALFATLMKVSNVCSITPYSCKKRDRRGWVVLNGIQENYDMFNE